ncbi:MAG: hypothetical protein WC964_01760 [Acholeplasmataceae bacterium]
MKKRVLFYFIVISLLITAGIIIYNDKEKKVPKLITVEQVYSYIYHPSQTMIIPVYLNIDNHYLANEKSYLSVYLSSDNNSKRIEMFELKIAYSHSETYLHETYYKYHFQLNLPNLKSDFYIKDCYLEISLVNQKTYRFYLGEFHLFTPTDKTEESLFLTSLYGNKKENEVYPRINNIALEFEDTDAIFTGAKINFDSEVLFEQKNNTLLLLIEAENKLLYQTPIRLFYELNQVEYEYDILCFEFFYDFEMLKKSGRQIYVYAID